MKKLTKLFKIISTSMALLPVVALGAKLSSNSYNHSIGNNIGFDGKLFSSYEDIFYYIKNSLKWIDIEENQIIGDLKTSYIDSSRGIINKNYLPDYDPTKIDFAWQKANGDLVKDYNEAKKTYFNQGLITQKYTDGFGGYFYSETEARESRDSRISYPYVGFYELPYKNGTMRVNPLNQTDISRYKNYLQENLEKIFIKNLNITPWYNLGNDSSIDKFMITIDESNSDFSAISRLNNNQTAANYEMNLSDWIQDSQYGLSGYRNERVENELSDGVISTAQSWFKLGKNDTGFKSRTFTSQNVTGTIYDKYETSYSVKRENNTFQTFVNIYMREGSGGWGNTTNTAININHISETELYNWFKKSDKNNYWGTEKFESISPNLFAHIKGRIKYQNTGIGNVTQIENNLTSEDSRKNYYANNATFDIKKVLETKNLTKIKNMYSIALTNNNLVGGGFAPSIVWNDIINKKTPALNIDYKSNFINPIFSINIPANTSLDVNDGSSNRLKLEGIDEILVKIDHQEKVFGELSNLKMSFNFNENLHSDKLLKSINWFMASKKNKNVHKDLYFDLKIKESPTSRDGDIIFKVKWDFSNGALTILPWYYNKNIADQGYSSSSISQFFYDSNKNNLLDFSEDSKTPIINNTLIDPMGEGILRGGNEHVKQYWKYVGATIRNLKLSNKRSIYDLIGFADSINNRDNTFIILPTHTIKFGRYALTSYTQLNPALNAEDTKLVSDLLVTDISRSRNLPTTHKTKLGKPAQIFMAFDINGNVINIGGNDLYDFPDVIELNILNSITPKRNHQYIFYEGIVAPVANILTNIYKLTFKGQIIHFDNNKNLIEYIIIWITNNSIIY